MHYIFTILLFLFIPSTNLQAQTTLIGSWLLKKISSEKTSQAAYILFLNEDKSFKIFQQQHIAASGEWQVNDKQTLVLKFSTGEETQYPIKRIKTNGLVLVDDNKNVIFKRLFL